MCPQSEVYKKSVATSVLAIRVPLSLFISLSMPLPRFVRDCVRVRVRVRDIMPAISRAAIYYEFVNHAQLGGPLALGRRT